MKSFFFSLLVAPAWCVAQMSLSSPALSVPQVDARIFSLRPLLMKEEFLNANNTSGQVGEYGWSFLNTAGTGSCTGVVSPVFGMRRVLTSGTSGDGSALSLTNANAGSTTTDPWTGSFRQSSCEIVMKLTTTSNINVRAGIGNGLNTAASGDDTVSATRGVYFRYDTSKSDPSWVGVIAGLQSGTEARLVVNTGVAPSTTSYQTLCIRRISSGVIGFSVDGSVEVTGTIGAITAYTGNSGPVPFAAVQTRATGTAGFDIDAFAWVIDPAPRL